MKRSALMMACAVALIFAGSARASLLLTSTGISDGFTLSTFATTNPGNTGCCSGPFGVAMASNGNVIVGSGNSLPPGTQRWVFPDIDGETVSTALYTNIFYPTTVGAFADAGGLPYANEDGVAPSEHQFLALNDDGSVNHVLTGVTAGSGTGMWGNPVNGHLIAQSSLGIIDIDPLANGGAGSFTVINSTQGFGLTVSLDGLTVYSVQGDQVKGYLISTGALVYSSPHFTGIGPEGVGIISSMNGYDGDFIVNANNGSIYLLDPVAQTYVAIASGGTYGTYVSPDLSNGTLFLDYSDIVARLGCGANCAIGSEFVVAAPEPANSLLIGTGIVLLCLGFRARRPAGV